MSNYADSITEVAAIVAEAGKLATVANHHSSPAAIQHLHERLAVLGNGMSIVDGDESAHLLNVVLDAHAEVARIVTGWDEARFRRLRILVANAILDIEPSGDSYGDDPTWCATLVFNDTPAVRDAVHAYDVGTMTRADFLQIIRQYM